MAVTQHNPLDIFASPLKTAAFLLEKGHEKPFQNGARFNLIGDKGERHEFRHSAQSLCEARDTILSLRAVQGGTHVEEQAAPNIRDARSGTEPQRT